MTLKYQTQINDKKESFITQRLITGSANPTTNLGPFWKQGVNIRASACGLLEGLQRISIRKIFNTILSRNIFLIYLVKIFVVPKWHGWPYILDMKSNFVSFYSFDIHVRLLPETVPKGTVVLQWPSAQDENPLSWFSDLGYIWAIPKFPAVQAGGHAQQCQGSALGASQPLQLTKFPHSQHAPNPTASTTLAP